MTSGDEIPDHPREPERGREVDLVGRGQPHQVVALAGAPGELALRVGDEHRAVAADPQADDRQEDLVLSRPPGARGVDVE